jgi:hypothetical protein
MCPTCSLAAAARAPKPTLLLAPEDLAFSRPPKQTGTGVEKVQACADRVKPATLQLLRIRELTAVGRTVK